MYVIYRNSNEIRRVMAHSDIHAAIQYAAGDVEDGEFGVCRGLMWDTIKKHPYHYFRVRDSHLEMQEILRPKKLRWVNIKTLSRFS